MNYQGVKAITVRRKKLLRYDIFLTKQNIISLTLELARLQVAVSKKLLKMLIFAILLLFERAFLSWCFVSSSITSNPNLKNICYVYNTYFHLDFIKECWIKAFLTTLRLEFLSVFLSPYFSTSLWTCPT